MVNLSVCSLAERGGLCESVINVMTAALVRGWRDLSVPSGDGKGGDNPGDHLCPHAESSVLSKVLLCCIPALVQLESLYPS